MKSISGVSVGKLNKNTLYSFVVVVVFLLLFLLLMFVRLFLFLFLTFHFLKFLFFVLAFITCTIYTWINFFFLSFIICMIDNVRTYIHTLFLCIYHPYTCLYLISKYLVKKFLNHNTEDLERKIQFFFFLFSDFPIFILCSYRHVISYWLPFTFYFLFCFNWRIFYVHTYSKILYIACRFYIFFFYIFSIDTSIYYCYRIYGRWKRKVFFCFLEDFQIKFIIHQKIRYLKKKSFHIWKLMEKLIE